MSTFAVVGASSLLGGEILRALEAHPKATLLPLSEKAAGTEVAFRREDVVVEELDDDALKQKPEAVIFATGAARSRRWAKKFVAAGIPVVDASAAHRLEPDVGLAGYGAKPAGRHLAIPSASALAAARLLGPLLSQAKAPRLTATLLVPVSSSGQAGVVELSRQTANLLGGRPTKAKRFPHRIAFNVIPEVGELGSDTPGESSTIERAFETELRRLLGRKDLPIAVTALHGSHRGRGCGCSAAQASLGDQGSDQAPGGAQGLSDAAAVGGGLEHPGRAPPRRWVGRVSVGGYRGRLEAGR
jgi:aspartate-semialdehyde dehydrogenase